MSETYTVGGDTWQPLVGFDISGQTFTPLESHIVNFIDVNLWLFGYTPPLLYLSQCDASHEPIPPILTDGHIVEPLIYLPPAKRRVRYRLDPPVFLQAGEIYSMRMRKALDHVGPDNQWLYDKDDATYPRGHIIFSDDGGHTWTHLPTSDFIFTEFGFPPLPMPTPVPTIANFAALALRKIHFQSFIALILATSVPCHLTCYYTHIKPVKHPTERVIRGATLPWSAYFCFVAWKFVEQVEPGDTLYHTFKIHDWSNCQVKWFTFRGTVDELTSPSIGPIFSHHHTGGIELALILRPIGKGYWCGIPTEVGDPCPDHWKNVDEEIPDEEETMLNRPVPIWSGWAYDFFLIQRLPTLPLEIYYITVTARARREGGTMNYRIIRLGILTHGRRYWQPTWQPVIKDWRDYKQNWGLNPYTSQPWTYHEINDLQIIVQIENFPREGVWEYCLVTQMYLTVHFRPQEA